MKGVVSVCVGQCVDKEYEEETSQKVSKTKSSV